jgi:amino-acid N-acetyltransferase
VQQAVGTLRSDLEARLSMGLVNSPQHGAEMLVISGNFIRAKPLGVIDGVDYQHTGVVRKVNTKAIRQQLDLGATLLISPLGYSLSGEIFNANSTQVAAEVAVALAAEKFISPANACAMPTAMLSASYRSTILMRASWIPTHPCGWQNLPASAAWCAAT